MFAYNPGVNDQSGQIIAQGAQNAAMINAQMMSDFGQNIGNSIAQLGEMYAANKELKARAEGYDDIAEVLGTAMFSNNPEAMARFSELKKEKDPRRKVIGYEQLFSVLGPLSNMMMADATRTSREGMQDKSLQQQMIMPTHRANVNAQADVASGQGRINAANIGYNPAVLSRRRKRQPGT